MRLSKLIGTRSKDNPSDANIKSHALMLRAGYMKAVANGIWTLAMPAKRIAQKIEAIIREEMDAIDGQEVTFPVVMPRELWEESGRYFSIGDAMVRFRDRNNRDMVLGMTHEEAAVHFVRNNVSSYQQLPCMIYQFQTKFRDEARPRGGLIRVREFTMKDAYSFHISQEDLEAYYQRVYDAYHRIFRRIGMKNFVAVKSDSGMMGGNISHEYMLLSPAGEDTIVICPHCDYKANMEVAECVRPVLRDANSDSIREVYTGAAKEIQEVCDFLKIPAEKTMKAVSFNIKGENTLVLCFLRGDLEVNEAKVKKILQKEIVPSNLTDSSELIAGNIGPIGLKLSDAVILFDASLKDTNNLVVGANRPEYHIVGVDVKRDLSVKEFYDISKVKAGEVCPVCGKLLAIENGIEIGNIFQLGTKYTETMGMTVLTKEGKSIAPIMGCYGIGVGRAIASVAEEWADAKGLNWPMAIAPWQVSLCPLRMDKAEVIQKAEELYSALRKAGVEVLYDDRDTSPGCKFADQELMGIPIRLVISPRSLEKNEAEIQMRTGGEKEILPYDQVIPRIKEIISESMR